MAYVRVAHRGVPVRPVLPNPRAIPIRPGCPHRQVAPMRLGLRNPQIAPVRPFIVHHHTSPRVPVYRPPPIAVKRQPPQNLPVLQPPIFPGLHSYDDDEEEHYHEETLNYPTVGIIDQHKIKSQQLRHRMPPLMSSQNHPRRLTRRVKPNYSSSFNYNR